MATNTYESPLNSRYASKEMQYIFSPDKKFSTWRKLWIALAESEKELGLDITDKQIAQMKEHIYDINYDVAKAREKEVRHDVMSHVYAYGVQCPDAKPIIHLGATSCYVGDNTDIIIMTEAMQLVKKKLVCLIGELAKFAKEYKDLPTLAFTHFQPAQPTTVGKRASLWLEDLLMTLRTLIISFQRQSFWAVRVQRVHRQVSLNFLRVTMKNVKCLTRRLPKKWVMKNHSL